MPLGLHDIVPTKAIDVSTLDGEHPTPQALRSQAAHRAGRHWDTILIQGRHPGGSLELRFTVSAENDAVIMEVTADNALENCGAKTAEIIDNWTAAWSYPMKRWRHDSSLIWARNQPIPTTRYPWKMILELLDELNKEIENCQFEIVKLFYEKLTPGIIAELPFTVYPLDGDLPREG